MSRWKASFIHLLISVFVVGSVAAYIVYFWYPPALMHMAKADRLLMLIGGVDLVVGPLLTLVVYKADKPKLKFDLAIIAIIQFSFLAYGLYVTWNSRPVFLVAVPDRFELVFANEIKAKELAKANDKRFKNLSFTKPVLVGAAMPSDPKLQEEIMLSAVDGHGDIQTMPRYFVDYSQISSNLLKHGKQLVKSSELKASDAKLLQVAAKAYGYDFEKLRYLNLASSRGFAVILVESDTGKVVGPANLDP
ncbi:MAG: TfpX/TfpZ family type IV pilin accessory protein [Arenimonas sp.]